MYVPFNDISSSSRIWIYQSNRILSEAEANQIKEAGKIFVEQWTAHKQTLHSSFEVLHNLFLIIAVDESTNDASGCSIDASLKFIRSIENQFKIKLLDRFAVAYITSGNSLAVSSSNKIVEMFRNNEVDENTIVFNNLISTKDELQTNWKIPFSKSWLKQLVV